MKTGIKLAVGLAVAALAAGSAWAVNYTNILTGNWDVPGSWSATPGAPSADGASDAVIVFAPAAADNSTTRTRTGCNDGP